MGGALPVPPIAEPVSSQPTQGQVAQTGAPTAGTPGAKEGYTAGQVATSCLWAIPILILAQIAEFFQSLWELIVWVGGLFKNKWFLLGFAVVMIFLILAAIGGSMQDVPSGAK